MRITLSSCSHRRSTISSNLLPTFSFDREEKVRWSVCFLLSLLREQHNGKTSVNEYSHIDAPPVTIRCRKILLHKRPLLESVASSRQPRDEDSSDAVFSCFFIFTYSILYLWNANLSIAQLLISLKRISYQLVLILKPNYCYCIDFDQYDH